MSVFFTSDTHFGHGNIIKYCSRPFYSEEDKIALEKNGNKWHDGVWKGPTASKHRISRDAIDMMNDHLTDQINEMVGPKDTLWHLGDFAFANKDKYYHKCRFYRDRIKCQNINIIWGNHDQPNKIRDLFNSSYDLKKIKVRDDNLQLPLNIVLCHYALAVWDGSHRGAWQLYGHSHSGAESWMNEHMPDRKSLDVGVDNAKKLLGEYRPFSLEELMNIFSRKLGHSMDHHIPKNSNAPSEEELSK
jgi:calcineurin-like phosphoesterase family protein